MDGVYNVTGFSLALSTHCPISLPALNTGPMTSTRISWLKRELFLLLLVIAPLVPAILVENVDVILFTCQRSMSITSMKAEEVLSWEIINTK